MTSSEVQAVISDKYEYFFPRFVKYFSSRMDNYSDAEDLVSNAILYCYKNCDKYDDNKASLEAWIFMVAKSRWKNYCRDKKIEMNLDDYSETLVKYDNEIEAAVYLTQLRQNLANALEQLTERQRNLIVWKFFGEKSTKEISEKIGINENNIRVQLFKAIKRLRLYMNDFYEG